MTKVPPSQKQFLIGYARESEIEALFELLGLVAKASHHVTRSQIEEIERFIACQLSSLQRPLAIESFRRGKSLPALKNIITTRAFRLYGGDGERWLEPIQVLDIMLRVGLIDDNFTQLEEHIVDCTRATLGVHKRSYWILRDTLAERFKVEIERTGSSFAKAPPHASSDSEPHEAPPKRATATLTRAEALTVLSLPADADEATIKSAYRALVKRFHPDMVEGSKSSDEILKAAVKRFCEIQEAYEALVGG